MHPWMIRRLMWGALLVWIGVMLVIDEPAGVASIGAGAILLVGAFLRKAMGQHAGFVLTLAGILLVAIGIGNLGNRTGIPLFAVALIAFGAFVIARAFGAPRGGTSIEIRHYYRSRARGDLPPHDRD